MSPSETIFLHARDLGDRAEQLAYLERACGGDAGLRAEVEALLQAAPEAAEFFEQADSRPVAESAGSIIGRHKP